MNIEIHDLLKKIDEFIPIMYYEKYFAVKSIDFYFYKFM